MLATYSGLIPKEVHRKTLYFSSYLYFLLPYKNSVHVQQYYKVGTSEKYKESLYLPGGNGQNRLFLITLGGVLSSFLKTEYRFSEVYQNILEIWKLDDLSKVTFNF